MLGQKIGDERGKVTARRVLPSDGQGPKMEVTFEARGQFVGIASVNVGTYWTVVQTNGLLYGEGEGFITTNQGDIVQWTDSGRGRLPKHVIAGSRRDASGRSRGGPPRAHAATKARGPNRRPSVDDR